MGLDNTQDCSRSVSNIIIDRSRLKRNNYILSLLQEGQRVGAITSKKAYQIQGEIMQVLQQLIRKYTQGKSTSVTSETAEDIMVSLIYAMDVYVLHFNNPEEAIVHLNFESIKDIHAKGVELLRQYYEDAKQLYQEMKKIRLAVPVDAYNMTIDESLPVFMKQYNIIFGAQNTMASIDYPLAIDDMRLQGVIYIKQYLERLRIETKFCQFFSHQDLMYVLTNFGKIYHFNYHVELFNIFELMVNNAVFSLLAGKKASQVRISETQYKQLNRMLIACCADQRSKLIHESIDQLQKELQTDQALTHYIDLYRNELVQRVNNAAKIGSFEIMIIREIEEHKKPMVLMLNENNRMSDIQMRNLVDRITGSDNTEKKVQLIRRYFVSLHDYLDLLNLGCLFADEYDALFDTLGDVELAILAKIVFYEKLRGDIRGFRFVVADGVEAESEWEMHYIGFMQQLDGERIEAVEHLIYDIDYEDLSFY